MSASEITSTLIVLLGAELFAITGMFVVYRMNYKSTNEVVKQVSALIKASWKQRFNTNEVDDLEQKIIDLFENYL